MPQVTALLWQRLPALMVKGGQMMAKAPMTKQAQAHPPCFMLGSYLVSDVLKILRRAFTRSQRREVGEGIELQFANVCLM